MDAGVDRAGRARRDQAEVLELHPAPRLRPARGAADRAPRPGPGRDRQGRARRRGARPRRSSRRCSPRRGRRPIEDMRQAADELRRELAGDTVTFVVNRNINVSNVCTVGCAFCGFGQGKRSPGRLRARPRGARAAGARGGGVRRHRDLHAVGHPPRLGARGLRALAARGEGGGARASTCTPTRRWRCRTCATSPASRPRAVFERLRAAGLGLHSGHGRRGAPRRRARADLAQQAAGGALGGGDRGLARAPACAPRSR